MATGEYFNHYHIIRASVLGGGILRPSLLSLPDRDDVQQEYILPTVDLDTLGRRPSNTLCNVKEYAVQLEMKTTDIDEYFMITRIIIYKLPTETGLPG